MKKILLFAFLFVSVLGFGQTLNPTYQSVTYSELGSFPSIRDGRLFKYQDSLWFDNGSEFLNVTRGGGGEITFSDTLTTIATKYKTDIYSNNYKQGNIVVRSSTGKLIYGYNVAKDSLDNYSIGDYYNLNSNISGANNTAFGRRILQNNTTGRYNSGFGDQTLSSNTSGGYNSAYSSSSLQNNTTGEYNCGYGVFSLQGNTTGRANIGLGSYSGDAPSTLSYRLYINSIDRSGISGDTTNSIIYGFQNASTTYQQLYLNANVNIKEGLIYQNTFFEDLNFTPLSAATGPTAPDNVSINNTIHKEFTSANNQSCGEGRELPHHYKLGTTLTPHTHIFLKASESAGSTGVTFTFFWELRQTTGTTSGSVTLSATSAQLAGNGNRIDIAGAAFAGAAELGSQLSVTIERTGGNAGDVVVSSFGVHYEVDAPGSALITTKF